MAKAEKKKGKGKGKGKKPEYPDAKPAGKSALRQRYEDNIIPALMTEFGYTSREQVPKVSKIVVNTTTKKAIQTPKVLDQAAQEIANITGQRPVITKARKSIATYKLRAGMPLGVKVTLRRDRMYDFLDKFVNITLPRIRDFRGVSPKAFDGRGNFSVGVTEQLIFPEIDYNQVERIHGLNISIITSAKTDGEGRALLKHIGMPLRK